MLPLRLARTRSLVAASVLLALAAGCGDPSESDSSAPLISLATAPTPPVYVSGGQTLLWVREASEVDPSAVTLAVNGVEVDAAVVRQAPPDPLGREPEGRLALVSGLVEGENEVVASLAGEPVATLVITNHPSAGPIFSGPHLEPYFCLDELAPDDGESRVFEIGTGEVLDGGGFDGDCHGETRVDYLYAPSGDDAAFRPLADPAELPADVATTAISGGPEIPFVVRLETGTINRAIYQTAVLVDPTNPEPDPWNPPAPWNGRLVYTFGGGCEAGYFQGTSTGGVLRRDMLGAGYAVASSTLNVNAQGGCNDPLSAETTLMVKERFAESVGLPVHTIGSGGSGGAMQQLLIAGAYPGILDGIMPTLTFPDAVTYFIDTPECRLLLRRYLNGRDLDDETKRVIGGWAQWETCEASLGPRPDRIGPDDCPGPIPQESRYHPEENPTGVRCSIYDAMHSVFGQAPYDEIERAPVVPFGRSPHDNVGVQYGLEALSAGLVSKELFLDLNENIGGWDIDFRWRPERTEADPDVVRIAYETGRVTSGAGGLAVTPILDSRVYLDQTGNFHTSYYSFAMRARLRRDRGTSENYVLLRYGSGVDRGMENLTLMDRWLTDLALDEAGGSLRQRIARNRPDALADSCWDESGTRIVEPQEFHTDRLFDNTEGRCNALYPPHAGPRMVAGGPLTNDVLKCRLKPLDRVDYEVEFTGEEWSRLQSIFPTGVCDWSQPGVGQDVLPRTWLSFGPSPVNRWEAPES